MRFLDSLMNLVTGMGTVKAKGSATVYSFTPMTAVELEMAYRGSWMARKVVDKHPAIILGHLRDRCARYRCAIAFECGPFFEAFAGLVTAVGFAPIVPI